MNEIEIQALENALKNKQVAILGDVMLDKYIKGRVERLSPEAPVPILVYEDTEMKLGGAANVALNIHHLGSRPMICSIIGDDKAGVDLLNCMDEIPSLKQYIVKSITRQTTVKTRLLGNNQHLLRLDDEDARALSDEEERLLIDKIDTLFRNEKIDILIFQDYDKGALTDKIISFTIQKCRDNKTFMAVDPKFDKFFKYKGVDLFKPNLKEVSQALNRAINPSLDSLNNASQMLVNKLSMTYCMITLSSGGIYLKSKEIQGEIIPTEVNEIVDVCGAGDAVLAVSTLMLHSNLGVTLVGRVANKAGKVVCAEVGVVPVRLHDLIGTRG